MTKVVTLPEAVAGIPDGALLTFGGFDLNRAPMTLAREIVRQGKRDLRVASIPNPLPLDLLVGAGRVAEATFGFLGFQYEGGFATAPAVRRAIEEGRLRFVEKDVYEIVQGFRAAAFGLPFLPAPGGEGTDYHRRTGVRAAHDTGDGDEAPRAPAIRPDVALIHAQEADPDGNLAIADPYAEDLLARASGRVIATAERIVARVAAPQVPGGRVERVAEAPGGALPTSCRGHYPWSVEGIDAHLAAAGAPRVREEAPDEARRAAVDRLVIGLARTIEDGDVVTTGLASALPMLAIALARATRAARLVYVNCVGAVDPRITRASFSSVDVRLLDDCRERIALPDLFDLAHRGGIDLMFFGAAQVDGAGRTNLTCIGDPERPRVKLPGPAGSPSMRAFVRKVVIALPRHSPRSLVRRVDFATSVPSPRNHVTLVVTDLGVLRLEAGRLRLAVTHSGVGVQTVRAATGFAIEGESPAAAPPTSQEREALVRLDPDGVRYRLA
jgi:acyl CoA:acetate/3-ketoacid CoA transferase alpha subunit/acyl CoA:acetate/3-ketoacid CoA transferase beta subunit